MVSYNGRLFFFFETTKRKKERKNNIFKANISPHYMAVKMSSYLWDNTIFNPIKQ